MNNCLYVLDLLTRGPLHLSKGWASGWSRPSHLSQSVNLLLWLSGPTRPGVWRPPRPWYQELLSKRFEMRQAGPHRTHSSDFILWTWTLLLVWVHTGHSSLWWCCINVPHSVSDATEFPWKGTFGYECNLGSLKREWTLRPQPYLLHACKRLAQTFKLVTTSFGQAL